MTFKVTGSSRSDHQTHGEKAEQQLIIKRFTPKERLDATIEGDCVHLYRLDSGWGFARIWMPSEKLGVSITGTLGGELYDGARVRAHGFWSNHNRYGWQVKLRALEVLLATSVDGVIAWFQDRFPDVGPIRARSLLDTFKAEIWDVIEKDHKRLSEAPQIGEKLAEQIHHTYISYKHEREAYVYLAKIGLSAEAIKRAFNLWGRDTEKRVAENPYRLMELPNVSFKQADVIARHAGVKAADPRRILAGYVFAMQLLEREGSTCATPQKLMATAAGKECLGLTLKTVKEHFDRAVEEGGLVGEFGMYFRRDMADAEHLIAEQVFEFLRRDQ